MKIDLSSDQREVYTAISRWSLGKSGGGVLGSTLTCGGLAGSGKSTLIGVFAAETKLLVAYVCFTGRAASNLRRKLEAADVETTRKMLTDDERSLTGRWAHLFYGRHDPEETMPFCDTIHRLLYRPIIDSRTEELRGWERRSQLDRSYDLIVVDEASMISDTVLEDLRAHGVRVLAVGDHGQLPPVRGSSSLMVAPDLRLEKIHRQAESSPIIRMAHALRTTGRFDPALADGNAVQVLSKYEYTRVLKESVATASSEESLNAHGPTAPLDVAVVCWKHVTRVSINRTVREMLGHQGKLPQVGEPVMALRNYPPVYNGMRGLLQRDAEQFSDSWWLLNVDIDFPDEGVNVENRNVCRDQFHRLPRRRGEQSTFGSVDELKEAGIKVDSMGEAGHLYDFGYAMTVHKSQGSQFEHVVVCVDWNEGDTDDARRLAYTAVTRASGRLTVLR
jgi:exodeoxyribonuclease-5